MRKQGDLFGYAYQIIDDIEDSGAGGKEQDKNTLLKTMRVSETCMEARHSLTKSIEAASAVFPGQALIKGCQACTSPGSKSLNTPKNLNILEIADDDPLAVVSCLFWSPCYHAAAEKWTTSTPFVLRPWDVAAEPSRPGRVLSTPIDLGTS